MGTTEWLLLLALSILWGGSYFFVEIALEELSPLLIVTVRVVLATLVLWVIILAARWRLPGSARTWLALLGMGVLNNVIPFLLIVWGQQEVASGLAAILNAATPIFTVLLAGLFLHDERTTPGKLLGAFLGLVGVVILIGPSALEGMGANVIAQLAILGAALSYAFAGIYARRFLRTGINPMVAAGGQLLASSVVLVVLALVFDSPGAILSTSSSVWAAIVTMAVFSTSLAYFIYFRLIATAGATNALLVTLLIPVTAILLGAAFLEERLNLEHFLGMAVVAAALSIIDGRLWGRRAK